MQPLSFKNYWCTPNLSFLIYKLPLFVFFATITLIARSQQIKKADSAVYASAKVNYRVFKSINNTWGYDIFVNDKMMVHQPSIPAVAGNDGFKTNSQCESVAKLVVSKIRHGHMPPSVTIDELRKLKAL